MKVVTIIGARPQFVKASAVSRVFKACDTVTEIIIHTGQHYDANMSSIFFKDLDIPEPHINLNINGLSHGAMTGQMLEQLEIVLAQEKPDWVLVYGDTNSTLAGALAAKTMKIKLAHVEAGLRSFNMDMPEEINRILTDRISDLLFCPTDAAVDNLLKEGFAHFDAKVVKTGDVMKDVSVFYADKAVKPKVGLPQRFVLCTVHRAGNIDDAENLQGIFNALEHISKEVQVIIPLHPRTAAALHKLDYSISDSSIHFIPPVSYLEMIYLLQHCELVMTDSGGLQKEAYFFAKHCITLRNETEWTELIENGCNVLAGSDTDWILYWFNIMIFRKSSNFAGHLYGTGDSAVHILREMLDY